MRLKTAKDACKEQLIRSGFKTKYSSQWLSLGGDKPGEVYDVWFPRGYRWDWFVRITKGTVVGYKDNGDWDSSSTIILTFV